MIFMTPPFKLHAQRREGAGELLYSKDYITCLRRKRWRQRPRPPLLSSNIIPKNIFYNIYQILYHSALRGGEGIYNTYYKDD